MDEVGGGEAEQLANPHPRVGEDPNDEFVPLGGGGILQGPDLLPAEHLHHPLGQSRLLDPGGWRLAQLGEPAQEGVDGPGVAGHRGLGEWPPRAGPGAVEEPIGQGGEVAGGELGRLGDAGLPAVGEEDVLEHVPVHGQGAAGEPGGPLLVEVVGDQSLQGEGLGMMLRPSDFGTGILQNG